MENLRPFQYHLEVYERSFVNDPSFSIGCSSPTPAFAVGNILDHRGYERWNRPPGPGEAFRIAEVRHILWEIDRSHVGHKLMLRVETVPAPE